MKRAKPTALQLTKNRLRRQAYAEKTAEIAAQRLRNEQTVLPLLQQISKDITNELGRPALGGLRDVVRHGEHRCVYLKVDAAWLSILVGKAWHYDQKGVVYCFNENGKRSSLHRVLLNGLRTTVHHRDGDPYNFERENLNAEPHKPRGVARKEHGSISETWNWNKRVSLTGCDVTEVDDGVYKVITPKTRRRAMLYSQLWEKEIPW